ncbi:HAD-IA family hydrolase [Candidatus Saganbacteria bacterium]|nr:HAD-IA family hydrolase [Candidatus Saganbacteria bacterium]
MDGVIIHTCPVHEAAWRGIATVHSLQWNWQLDYTRDVFGTASPDSARLLFQSQIPDHKMAAICQEKNRIYEELLRSQILKIVVPGFHNFFESIRSSGVPIALATSSSKNEAEFVLGSLGIRAGFTAVIDVSQVAKPKPDPEIYAKACGAIGLFSYDCFGFEDSLIGIEAQNRAGLKCIVVGTMLEQTRLDTTPFKYVKYIPDFSVISLGEISLMFSLAQGGG